MDVGAAVPLGNSVTVFGNVATAFVNVFCAMKGAAYWETVLVGQHNRDCESLRSGVVSTREG